MASYIPLADFVDNTKMWRDDPATIVAWMDFIDQDLPFWEWWAEFQGDYV